MANDITNFISMTSKSDQGQEAIDRVLTEVGKLMADQSVDRNDVLPLVFFGKRYDELDITEFTGTKWFYLMNESFISPDEDIIEVRSAWGPCTKFGAYLFEKMQQMSGDISVRINWQNEDDECNTGIALFGVDELGPFVKEAETNTDIVESFYGKPIDDYFAFDDRDEYEEQLAMGFVDEDVVAIFRNDIEKLLDRAFENAEKRRP